MRYTIENVTALIGARRFGHSATQVEWLLTDSRSLVFPETTLFPYMQLVRFYADYLNGDTYYKIQYPEHNLVRSRNQLTLLQRAEECIPEMEAFIKEQLGK